MSISREQVAGLREGDVVEYRSYAWPADHKVTGALYERDGGLWLAGDAVRFSDGDVTAGNYHEGTLTVVSRAPRPLYVNHPRTEPEYGDTAGWEGDQSGRVYWRADGFWLCNDGGRYDEDQMPARLRLLVDGETGQVVQ